MGSPKFHARATSRRPLPLSLYFPSRAHPKHGRPLRLTLGHLALMLFASPPDRFGARPGPQQGDPAALPFHARANRPQFAPVLARGWVRVRSDRYQVLGSKKWRPRCKWT